MILKICAQLFEIVHPSVAGERETRAIVAPYAPVSMSHHLATARACEYVESLAPKILALLLKAEIDQPATLASPHEAS